MYIDEEKARELLCDIAVKTMTDTSEEADAHNQQALGMMIMCVNLGIITEKECSILMDYTARRCINDDFVDSFISGLYRHAPDPEMNF